MAEKIHADKGGENAAEYRLGGSTRMELVVTPKEISHKFDALISGAESRESVEDWAQVRLDACDARTLRYEPPNDEARLWKAIKYLLGVGVQTEHGYLFSNTDFQIYRQEHGF